MRSRPRMKEIRVSLVLCLCVIVSFSAAANAQRRRGNGSSGFSFRFLGPRAGHRVSAIAGVPGDTSTYYAGAASGGIWKSTDGGEQWQPIFDDQPVAAIGALAVAPSDPNIVWAGTGEAWAIRASVVGGYGVYKSTEAGKTWTNMGLPEAGRIGRVIVDSNDVNNVWVCALGRMTGPQKTKGVYHSTDGGKNWNLS